MAYPTFNGDYETFQKALALARYNASDPEKANDKELWLEVAVELVRACEETFRMQADAQKPKTPVQGL